MFEYGTYLVDLMIELLDHGEAHCILQSNIFGLGRLAGVLRGVTEFLAFLLCFDLRCLEVL
jgi:hypothetical protein